MLVCPIGRVCDACELVQSSAGACPFFARVPRPQAPESRLAPRAFAMSRRWCGASEGPSRPSTEEAKSMGHYCCRSCQEEWDHSGRRRRKHYANLFGLEDTTATSSFLKAVFLCFLASFYTKPAAGKHRKRTAKKEHKAAAPSQVWPFYMLIGLPCKKLTTDCLMQAYELASAASGRHDGASGRPGIAAARTRTGRYLTSATSRCYKVLCERRCT